MSRDPLYLDHKIAHSPRWHLRPTGLPKVRDWASGTRLLLAAGPPGLCGQLPVVHRRVAGRDGIGQGTGFLSYGAQGTVLHGETFRGRLARGRLAPEERIGIFFTDYPDIMRTANTKSGAATLRLTSFTDYGLRVLMRMAGQPDRAFTAADLAAEFRVSRNHLAKVISALAAAGLLQTRRGGGGGATLARPAQEIRLGDVVAVLEADQALVECFSDRGNACTLTPRCRLKARLLHAESAFLTDLNRSSLADCVYQPESA